MSLRREHDDSADVINHGGRDDIHWVNSSSLAGENQGVCRIANAWSLVILQVVLCSLSSRSTESIVVANEVGWSKTTGWVGRADKDLNVFGVGLDHTGPLGVTTNAVSIGSRTVIVVVVVSGRVGVVVICEIDLHGRPDLLHIGEVLGFFGGFFCFCEDREENGGQDGNDRDDDQKLNKSECTIFHFKHLEVAVCLVGDFALWIKGLSVTVAS